MRPERISQETILTFIMKICSSRERNTQLLRHRFNELLVDSGVQGVLGIAAFAPTYEGLLPIQQNRLKLITRNRFESYIDSGYFISIGIAYKDSAIDDINVLAERNPDMKRWNHYASEYDKINALLDGIARTFASEFDGIAIPATLSGLAKTVRHVSDYYEQTVSHRAIAENAGLGWRGKNGLIINSQFSCALRFVSIITQVPLSSGERLESQCGQCTACEDACSFIKNRAMLKDYRENCRRYLINLQKRGLSDEVCGKCIQACYRKSIFSKQFSLENVRGKLR